RLDVGGAIFIKFEPLCANGGHAVPARVAAHEGCEDILRRVLRRKEMIDVILRAESFRGAGVLRLGPARLEFVDDAHAFGILAHQRDKISSLFNLERSAFAVCGKKPAFGETMQALGRRSNRRHREYSAGCEQERFDKRGAESVHASEML